MGKSITFSLTKIPSTSNRTGCLPAFATAKGKGFYFFPPLFSIHSKIPFRIIFSENALAKIRVLHFAQANPQPKNAAHKFCRPPVLKKNINEITIRLSLTF